jgi:hypothetical protein
MQKTNKIVTHKDLVEAALRWLERRSIVTVAEMATAAGEEPDAMGWKSGGIPTVVECKVSNSDFKADGKKISRRMPENGLGVYRYYLALPGVISVAELPPHWGLLVYNPGTFKITCVRRAAAIKRSHMAIRKEVALLLSAIRRIGNSARNVVGVSVRPYKFANKGRAQLGIAVEPS